jgi:hypothetical protein
MLYACVERFDVMGGRENILGWDGEVNKALGSCRPAGPDERAVAGGELEREMRLWAPGPELTNALSSLH